MVYWIEAREAKLWVGYEPVNPVNWVGATPADACQLQLGMQGAAAAAGAAGAVTVPRRAAAAVAAADVAAGLGRALGVDCEDAAAVAAAVAGVGVVCSKQPLRHWQGPGCRHLDTMTADQVIRSQWQSRPFFLATWVSSRH